MEAKLRSEEHESYQAHNSDECAKQHEVTRRCVIRLLCVNMADIWRERDMTLSREVLRWKKFQVTTNRKKSADVVVA